ncbi:hypothetical protein A2662_04280 [Candidatus Giovannonibacteria bacterium RIFCSPHIGHO2_01_FULL_45_33]|uniref:EfeO-type cupredoxin-like domain-containing protein n=1 Tax=Candidatus Giovannonibacteria bacterium RIFCSPLOWO2_01_FULL_45_34 TaxID=1798351 RepID=A0A1F5WZ95_9BACT|nr:MAG: hypothetical protein A2662_04280 [Candidatus Giovannonibacteria bacterium RIFCSPHIGHO2_01_FULL_45_33]OGF80947.1 MAG: hypothetical protein A2930_02585 [Candidatus Giovannonibacteria bacterium RIFCSPLOWO2_01_FULL_45_34]
MKTILIIVGFLAVLGLGWYFYGPALGIRYEKPNNSPPAESFALPTSTPTPTVVSSEETGVKFAVSMTSSGFVPSQITIKKGTAIVFTNNDTVPHWPASSKHPSHLDYPGFDSLGGVAPGASYAYTFNEVKSIGVHDHLNPSLFGKITVIE